MQVCRLTPWPGRADTVQAEELVNDRQELALTNWLTLTPAHVAMLLYTGWPGLTNWLITDDRMK